MNKPLQRIVLAGLLVLSLQAKLVVCRKHCGPGEMFVPGTAGHHSHCNQCPPGYFQERHHHRHRYCERCQIFDEFDPREILYSECTRFQDIVVHCVDGFYWKAGDCLPCTDCTRLGQVQDKPCHRGQDTVCLEIQDIEENTRFKRL